jgi:hypothetical protein
MTTSSDEAPNTDKLDGKAEALLDRHRDAIRKQAGVMLAQSGRDIADMTLEDIKNWCLNFRFIKYNWRCRMRS